MLQFPVAFGQAVLLLLIQIFWIQIMEAVQYKAEDSFQFEREIYCFLLSRILNP